MKLLHSLLPLCISAAVILLPACNTTETPEAIPMKTFDLSDVGLLDGPFLEAQQTSLEYILELDPDRLLAPFLKEAGLKPLKENYGNWENTGLDGHIGGHYLTSLSLMYAATGKEELRERLDYMIGWLKKCQESNGNGYVGGIPGSAELWNEIADGNIRAGGFSLNSRWVPLYNIHKLFAGLRDAYQVAGNEEALDILVDLTDWFIMTTQDLSNEQVQDMLRSEHGGLNEVFADVYALTGEEKYLDLAERFSHHALLDPLLQRENPLEGMHANTQIPKVIGFKRVAELSSDTAWSGASAHFWDLVAKKWTVSIGGNSVREHFHPADDFSSMVESEQGPETCNTYNMLKLSRMLYLTDPRTEYIDYYERAMYNHILSSQHPDIGGYVYFTPMRPRHYRVYSTPQQCFWCCVGSGLENHAKYGEMIYTHSGDKLFINLFMASELNWKGKGLKVTQETSFPYEDDTRLNFNLEEPQEMDIYIRVPSWIDEETFALEVNGKRTSGKNGPPGYRLVERTWNDGDAVSVSFTSKTFIEGMPDGSGWISFIHGPLVLAAITSRTDLDGLFADDGRMAHVANGKFYPLDEAPALILEETADPVSKISKDENAKLMFTLNDLENVPGGSLKLQPFFEIHEARYMTYWPVYTPADYAEHNKEIARRENALMALEERTIDQVNPGEQQPESDHFVKFENSNAGVHKDRHWRDARGWFSYQLKNPGDTESFLRLTFYGRDSGREFFVKVNDRVLAEITLEGEHGDTFFDMDIPVPAEMVKRANGGPLVVKFEAKEGFIAGGVFGIRLMKAES